MSSCHICNSPSAEIFKARVLSKYDVSYFKCSHCGFIQTEHPYWLEEAYQNAIASLDIGIIGRNINAGNLVEQLINNFFDGNAKYVDYGGGYGMFVRLMRDKGFNFYRQDIFCDNLFAQHFDISDLGDPVRFELLTAFEVFEHVEKPVQNVATMLELSDNIFFSTELQPANVTTPQSWWYFVPETGQHISFFTKTSLEIMAEKFGSYFHTSGNFHLFTKKKISHDRFRAAINYKGSIIERVGRKLSNRKKRTSLLSSDFELIKKKIMNDDIS